MRATPVWRNEAAMEFLTAERCFILETYNTSNDETLSIARARVPPGVTTALHAVEGTTERYIIAEGRGRVEVGEMPSQSWFSLGERFETLQPGRPSNYNRWASTLTPLSQAYNFAYTDRVAHVFAPLNPAVADTLEIVILPDGRV